MKDSTGTYCLKRCQGSGENEADDQYDMILGNEGNNFYFIDSEIKLGCRTIGVRK
jgi:hypothetical protein